VAVKLNPRMAPGWFLSGVTLLNAFQDARRALPYFQEAERLGSKDAAKAIETCRTALAVKEHAH